MADTYDWDVTSDPARLDRLSIGSVRGALFYNRATISKGLRDVTFSRGPSYHWTPAPLFPTDPVLSPRWQWLGFGYTRLVGGRDHGDPLTRAMMAVLYVPIGAVPDRPGHPTPGGQVLVGSFVSEGGSGLAWLDARDGRKVFGQMWIGGVWTGATQLARDDGPSALPDLTVVTAGGLAMKPKSFTDGGAPVYDATATATFMPDCQRPTSSGGGQAIVGHDGRVVLTVAPKPFAPQSIGGGVAGRATKEGGDRKLTVAIRSEAPTVDGKLDDWADAQWATVDVRLAQVGDWGKWKVVTRAAIRVAGDRLYAAFETDDPKLIDNAGGSLPTLFKTGGALDLTIGADPAADDARRAPVGGDVRLLVAHGAGTHGGGALPAHCSRRRRSRPERGRADPAVVGAMGVRGTVGDNAGRAAWRGLAVRPTDSRAPKISVPPNADGWRRDTIGGARDAVRPAHHPSLPCRR